LQNSSVIADRLPHINVLAVSPDGTQAASGSDDGTIRLWSLRDKKELATFQQPVAVTALAYLADQRFLFSSGSDGALRLWDRSSGKILATMVSFADGNWVVADDAGRFDTSDLEAMDRLHWVDARQPFRALPLELFMRQYFEPGLLVRKLAGEQL